MLGHLYFLYKKKKKLGVTIFCYCIQNNTKVNKMDKKKTHSRSPIRKYTWTNNIQCAKHSQKRFKLSVQGVFWTGEKRTFRVHPCILDRDRDEIMLIAPNYGVTYYKHSTYLTFLSGRQETIEEGNFLAGAGVKRG